jgi:hypothetical protein
MLPFPPPLVNFSSHLCLKQSTLVVFEALMIYRDLIISVSSAPTHVQSVWIIRCGNLLCSNGAKREFSVAALFCNFKIFAFCLSGHNQLCGGSILSTAGHRRRAQTYLRQANKQYVQSLTGERCAARWC